LTGGPGAVNFGTASALVTDDFSELSFEDSEPELDDPPELLVDDAPVELVDDVDDPDLPPPLLPQAASARAATTAAIGQRARAHARAGAWSAISVISSPRRACPRLLALLAEPRAALYRSLTIL